MHSSLEQLNTSGDGWGTRSIGDMLLNYRERYGSLLSARKIKEPLVRALYWKQDMWWWTSVYRDAENPSLLADVASDELAKSRAEYRLIIRHEWAARREQHSNMETAA